MDELYNLNYDTLILQKKKYRNKNPCKISDGSRI